MDNKTFLEKVGRSSELESKTCKAFLDTLTELMEATIAAGDTISIPSFGNFEPRKRNERMMSQPNGRRLLIPPKLVVNFKPSTILKDKVNNIKPEDE